VYQARLPSRHGELAYHLDRAGPLADPAKAVEYAVLAGRAALDQYAGEEAASHFEAALRHLARQPGSEGSELHREVLLSLGRALARLDRPGYRDTLDAAAELAVASGDLPRATQAVVTAGRAFASRVGEVDGARVDLLRRALSLAGTAPSPERAILLARLGAELSYDDDPRRPTAIIDEALSVARATGDARSMAFVLATAYAAVWREEMYSDELRALADQIGDPGLAFLAEHQRSNQASWEGDRDRADAAFATADAMVVGMGDRRAVWLVELTRAKHAMMRGELDEADALASHALAVGQASGQPDAFDFYASQLLAIRWLAGRHGELAPLVEAAGDAIAELPAFRAARALVLHEVGRAEESATELVALRAKGFERQPVAGNPIVPYFVLAQLCADLGASVAARGVPLAVPAPVPAVSEADAAEAVAAEAVGAEAVGASSDADVAAPVVVDQAWLADAARELLGLLVPLGHLHAGSVNLWLGPASHPIARLQALVGDDAAADEAFALALDVYRGWGCREMAALVAVQWAEALVTRAARGGHVDRALRRHLADEALAVAVERGLDRLADRARAAASGTP
jgi:hypothetical protein